MLREEFEPLTRAADGPALQAHVLGLVDFDEALALQRRLVYEISGGHPASLILCEHPPLITVGRHGSRAHIHIEDRDLALHGWPVRWINRGGGCWLHAPGQLAIYPLVPLDSHGLTLGGFLRRLQEAIAATLADFTVPARLTPGSPDVWIGDQSVAQPVACLGVAVRNGVTYHGAVLNVDPDLTPMRDVLPGKDLPPMTSLVRQRHGRVRPGMVRQRLLEHLALRLGFSETILFTDHVHLRRKAAGHASLAAH